MEDKEQQELEEYLYLRREKDRAYWQGLSLGLSIGSLLVSIAALLIGLFA